MRTPTSLLAAAAFAALIGGGVFGSAALAGGLGGDTGPSRIPVPAKELTATLTDRTGTEVTLDRFTMNGEVFVYGKLGAGQVSLTFEKLARVDFGDSTEEHVRTATATLRDGSTVSIGVEDDQVFYGRAPWGLYQIEAIDVASIAFPAPAAP